MNEHQVQERGVVGPVLASNPQGADGPLIGQPVWWMPSDRVITAREGRTPAPARVRVEASAGGGADVWISGDIGNFWGDGNDASTVRAQIGEHKGPLTVHLNSGGGSAFDGVEMYNALKGHPGGVHVHVEGLAASAASVIAMAGTTRTMHTGAQMMIHDAACGSYGNAADLRDAADVLERVSAGLADIYAEATGQPAEHWREMMRAETWYDADEAVAAGLATGVHRPAAKEPAQAPAADAWGGTMPLVAWTRTTPAPPPSGAPTRPAATTWLDRLTGQEA